MGSTRLVNSPCLFKIEDKKTSEFDFADLDKILVGW